MLHKSPNLSAAMKKKLPQPIGEEENAAHSIFTETLIDGRLAWKVNQKSLRKKIFDEAESFIFDLQLSFRQSVVFSEQKIQELFHGDIEIIDTHNPIFKQIFLCLIQNICYELANDSFYMTVSHGDYGYGNILVHPSSGSLSGVIDWDTGRMEDLPGIDYLNFIVQKKRIEFGLSIEKSFIDTFEEIKRTGNIDDKNFYANEFNITGKRIKIIFFACLVRFISRAAQYPDVFYKDQQNYINLFNYLGHRENMISFYNSLDLYINTSNHEGTPMSILEAMAVGLPVIAFNVGGLGEIITNNFNGFIVPKGDIGLFASKILKLIDTPELLKTIGEGAQKKIYDQFSMQHMLGEYISLYHILAG